MRKSFKNLFFLSFLLNIHIPSPQIQAEHFLGRIKESFDNFCTVEPNKLYRSKQLSDKRLDFYIKKYGIKTIVNLRGENPNKKWWRKERDVVQKNNANFYNISMRARKLPKKEQIIQLLNIYDKAPKPILIHCQWGANRTGEAAALWKIYKQGESKEKALAQLSIKYGHIKSKNSAKDFFISIWQGRKWLEKQYDPKNYPEYN